MEEFLQDGEVEVLSCPANELLEVHLGDRTYRIKLDIISVIMT